MSETITTEITTPAEKHRRYAVPVSSSTGEKGLTLIETIIALAVISIVAVIFLYGVSASSKFTFQVDERVTAESLAQSQMEWVKSAEYSYNATGYSAAPVPADDELNEYSVNITAGSLHASDEGIQKIIVTVLRSGEEVFVLESYKVDR